MSATAAACGSPPSRRRSARRSRRAGPSRPRAARRRLFARVPGAERDPLRPVRRELLRPDRDELAVLPLEHVVLDPRVRVLAVLVELHAPAVDHRADGEVERHHGVTELGEVVALRPIEDDLEEPEAAAGELVAAERVGAGPLLDGLAELAFELLALGLERLDRKSTRLNSSHANISYAVFCL